MCVYIYIKLKSWPFPLSCPSFSILFLCLGNSTHPAALVRNQKVIRISPPPPKLLFPRFAKASRY